MYPTTKGAIIQMTRAMAAQHGAENIRVNCVCPGMVFTPMVRGRGMTDKMRQDRINQNLLKQEGTGWDVGYGMKLSHKILLKQGFLTLDIQQSCSSAARKLNGSPG